MTGQTEKNIPYYLTAACLFIALKFGYKFADNDDLSFLLRPTNKLVELLTGSNSIYLPDSGFYYETLHILIDKSCSGFNFWMLSFIIFTYLIIGHSDKHSTKIPGILMAFIGAYLLTIFVNTSRIFVSIIVQSQTKNILNQQHIIHEAVGIVTNLTFLVLTYFLIEKLLKQKQSNAEPA